MSDQTDSQQPDNFKQPTAQSTAALGIIMGIVGAVAGGIAGHFAFMWIAKQGFYAIILPGALAGIGCSLLSGRRSIVLAVICGIVSLALGLFSEWRMFPFIVDHSLSYFVTHLCQLRPLTWILLGLGTVFGAWFGIGKDRH